MLRKFAPALLPVLLLAACGEPEQPARSTSVQEEPAGPLPVMLYAPGGNEAFVVAQGNTVESLPSGDGVLVRSTATALNPQGDGNSAALRIPDEARNLLSGKTARVTIRARSAGENGTHVFRAFYSRPGVTSSGWIEFRPTETAQDFVFDFPVPADVQNAYSNDLVGIWADPEGRGRGLEVSLVQVGLAPSPAQ